MMIRQQMARRQSMCLGPGSGRRDVVLVTPNIYTGLRPWWSGSRRLSRPRRWNIGTKKTETYAGFSISW